MKKPIKTTSLPKRLKMTYVKEIETSELDFVLYDEVFGKKYDGERDRDILVGTKGKSWTREGDPISIKMVRSFLDKLEKAGATHVEIMHHSDHRTYVFNGIKIVEATETECLAEVEKEKKRNEIKKEIDALDSQRDELAKKYKSL